MDIQAWCGHRHPHYTGDYDDGHYVVVIGYDNEQLIFEDPSLMNRGYLTIFGIFGALARRGKWAGGSHVAHLGIAIYGKPPRFHSSTIKHIR